MTAISFKNALLIGRFQPFHSGHLSMVRHGLSLAEQLVIVLGSAYGNRTIKNPFTVEERMEMFKLSLPKEHYDRISFIPVRDYHYNDNKWCTEVRNKVKTFAGKSDMCMIGYPKDYSSYYLYLFKELPFHPLRDIEDINATDVRTSYFDLGKGLNNLPWAVYEYLSSFRATPAYETLKEEYRYYKAYRDAWVNSAFPPMFVTVDGVIEHNGHILLIERKEYPGKGLLALPGGFVNQNERLMDAVTREVEEETHFKINSNYLKECRAFDYPQRSLRGRVITHGYYFNMPESTTLNEIFLFPGDDASKAFWMSIPDIYKNEEKFFDDHFHIITYFIEGK